MGTVCRYIEEHLPDRLSRDELASVAYLSPDRLSHLFTEKMGVSLTAYIAGAFAGVHERAGRGACQRVSEYLVFFPAI